MKEEPVIQTTARRKIRLVNTINISDIESNRKSDFAQRLERRSFEIVETVCSKSSRSTMIVSLMTLLTTRDLLATLTDNSRLVRVERVDVFERLIVQLPAIRLTRIEQWKGALLTRIVDDTWSFWSTRRECPSFSDRCCAANDTIFIFRDRARSGFFLAIRSQIFTVSFSVSNYGTRNSRLAHENEEIRPLGGTANFPRYSL